MARKAVLEGGKRDEIIMTAMKLFFEHGYEATSVRMIMNEVGGEIGMFYHYFKSKDMLFDMVVERFFKEYREKFEENSLEVVITEDRENLQVKADGNLLWRVLNNLYNNICKYAQPNTRVYVNVSEEEKNVIIDIKNISREMLNISADELMERFVRGDSSRHTEGSGLGLNIARSLMDVMKGSLDISIDGDLFKSEITLPKA